MMRRYLKTLANPHFWAIVALLVVGVLLHYPQQLLGIDSPSVFSFLGLTRHAVERILMLLPVSYAAFVFGPRAGLTYLAIATAIMLPRVFLISQYFPDSMLETIGVIVVGVLINLWCHGYRRERARRQRMLSELETTHRELEIAHRQLQARTATLEENERQLKESQEQLIQAEKLTSLGQLAASVAHEVNNPLSGVLVYAQLLAKKIAGDSITKETTLDYLSKMESELVRSTKLVRNLLDFARQSPPAFRQVNLNDVINRALDLAAHSAQLQHVQIINEPDLSLPTVTADSDQLQQVFTNLILNAIQAMTKGGTLTLRTSVEHEQLKVEVRDTGHGISPENMRRLFTPFFTTKQEVKGVGLGLAVAYGIIQRHKGRIEVQSQEGVGTTFTVYLPLASSQPTA